VWLQLLHALLQVEHAPIRERRLHKKIKVEEKVEIITLFESLKKLCDCIEQLNDTISVGHIIAGYHGSQSAFIRLARSGFTFIRGFRSIC
jgi:hypothetical protein